jgi:hypothetical protein
MRFATLILRAVDAALREDPAILGLRLSPATVTKEDVRELLAEAKERSRAGLFVVASAPDVPFVSRERICTAPDERAAEQATAWRNAVNVSAGEHLLYVSAEEHDKASGLRDCLLQLTEDDLHQAFVAWCEEPESEVPGALATALGDAGLTDRVPAATLCEFARAVAKDAPRSDAWEAAGKNLPVLGLVRDSRLSRTDAAERLSANERLVRRAATTERRRQTAAAPTSDLQAAVRDVLGLEGVTDVKRGLGKLDLGEFRTKQLAVAPAVRKAKAKPEARASKAKVDQGKRGTGKKGRDSKRGPESRPKEKDKAIPGIQVTLKPDEEVAPRKPAARHQEHATSKGEEAPKPRRLAVAELPTGVQALFAGLMAAEGAELEWEVRGDARRCLSALPGGAESKRVRDDDRAHPALADGVRVWSEARRALVATLAPDGDVLVGITQLTRAPVAVLRHQATREAAAELLRSTAELHGAALRAADESAMRAVLALDTVAIRDAKGPALRLLSPLHPLWLSQALAVAQVVESAPKLDDIMKRLLGRALEVPVAPQLWPEQPQCDLTAARPECGLVTYEREPDAITGPPLVRLGERTLRRFLALCPHAHLGVRVAILGGDPSQLVEGFARHLNDAPDLLRRVEVFCQRPLVFGQHSQAPELVASGKLLPHALPLDERRVAADIDPHLIVRIAGRPRGPEADEPSAPLVTPLAPGGGLLRTHFEVRERGLRARTSVRGDPALEPFEALYAACWGRRAIGELRCDSSATSLSALVVPTPERPATWHVVVGPNFGRRPPAEHHLLVHERVSDEATCAIIVRDVQPASRALADALRVLGLSEDRPRVLRALAAKLASTNACGLVSLERTSEHLIAAGVLALEMQRRAGERPVVIARVEGLQLAALLGEQGENDPMGAVLIGFGPRGDDLHLQLGYATLDQSVDVEFSNGRLGGDVGRRIKTLSSVVELARSGEGVMATAAREALGWLLWPALATDGRSAQGLHAALRRFTETGNAEVEGVCLLPLAKNASRGKTWRAGDIPVAISSLDVDLFSRLVLNPVAAG